MINERAWDALLAWAQGYDDRAVSDAARRWSDTEAEVVVRPKNDGEWKASMEAAFDAGRAYERLNKVDV